MLEKNHIFIYHSADFDGLMCAALASHALENDVLLIGWNYDKPTEPIEELIDKKSIVYFADVSFKMDKMIAIAHRCQKVILLDHHKTVFSDPMFREFAAMSNVNTMYADTEHAGCEITADFFGVTNSSVLRLVHALGRYDVWDHDYRYITWRDLCAIQAALKTKEYTPEMLLHDSLDPTFVSGLIQKGKPILDYVAQQDKAQCARYAFVAKLGEEYGGKRVACICSAKAGSSILEKFAADNDCKISAVFCARGDGSVTLSVYSSDVDFDCGEFCKKFGGGGGHKGAAGCTLTNISFLPWESI